MAKVKSGFAKSFSGSINGITYSQHDDGTTTSKAQNKRSLIPLTIKQESVLQDTILINTFLSPIKDFLKVGYSLEAKGGKKNYYNVAVPLIRQMAIQGDYPNRNIELSKIMLTKGELDSPSNASVISSESGLIFSWDTAITSKTAHHSDHVMMLAYFPEQKTARYITSGAQRYIGEDVLILNGINRGQIAELYISFIADDHRNIANSVYLGQIIY